MRETALAYVRHGGNAVAMARRAARPSPDRALPDQRACASCSASSSTTPTPASSWSWRCARRLSGAALARQGAEDGVPERRGDAVAVAVVLEVVAHVLLAQPLAEVGLRHEVVHVVVRVVVDEVAGDEAAEEREGGRGAEDQREGEEEEGRQRDRHRGGHHQPQLVVGVVVVDAVDDEVHAAAEGVVGLPVEDEPVQPVLGQGPDADPGRG